MTHVLKPGADRNIASPADIAAKTRHGLSDRELRVALLNHGVFSVHGGGSLSECHNDTEVSKLIDAYAAAARDIKPLLG